jgi:hypothetical protein
MFIFFTKPVEAFVFSFTNKGIEWGWEGEKHFKFYQSLVLFRTSSIDGTRYNGANGSIYFRWLKLTHNNININFSSGFGILANRSDFIVDFNHYTDLCTHLTALAIEPEFLFNERYSLFLRLPVLQYSYYVWSAYGPIKAGFHVAHINVGISINFKGKKNIEPGPGVK